MKKILLLSIGFALSFTIHAQSTSNPEPGGKKTERKERVDAMIKMEEEGEMIFNKQNVFGFKLNTDGWGISFEKGKYLTPRKTRLLQFEFNEKKHPKEDKDVGSFDVFSGNVSQFVFGKANNFYQFKAGYGLQYLIGGKANKNGVVVSAIGAGGLSLGLVKPYYVDVEEPRGGRVKFQDVNNLDSLIYIGASGLTVGWNEVQINPGLHAKTALWFDYGRFNEMVSAIEAGVNLEYYSKEVLQMVQNKPKHLFFNAYVSLEFGKRK